MIDANQVATFLETDIYIRLINFSFDLGIRRIDINPGGYKKIAAGLRAEQLKVDKLTPEKALALKADSALGVYQDETIYLGFDSPIIQAKFVIIHECTHAILDAYNLGSIKGVSNEAAAFIAEVIYCVATNNTNFGGDRADSIQVLNAALPIAKRIASGNGKLYQLPKNSPDLINLVNKISGTYNIKSSDTDTSDGIPGVVMNAGFQKPQRKDSDRRRQ